jgi:hypothetical protein
MSEFDTPVENPASPEIVEKQENVFTGIIGAFLGACIGGAAIVLLNQLGYIASISGLILAVCTLKGYELLGGKRSTTGIIISIALMLIMPYIADRISWALEIVKVFAEEGVTFAAAFASVHEIVELNELTADYFKDLGMVYLFTAIGAIGTLRTAFAKK